MVFVTLQPSIQNPERTIKSLANVNINGILPTVEKMYRIFFAKILYPSHLYRLKKAFEFDRFCAYNSRYKRGNYTLSEIIYQALALTKKTEAVFIIVVLYVFYLNLYATFSNFTPLLQKTTI